MKLNVVGIILLLILVNICSAAPNEWIDYGKITNVVEDTGGLYLYTEKVGTGTAGIEACGGNRLYIANDDTNRLRSLVYMAYAKGDSVFVYTQECKTQWGTSFTRVRALHVK